MKKLIALLLFLFTLNFVFAQKSYVKVTESYTFSYAFAKDISLSSFMYNQILQTSRMRNFAFGSGIRLSRFSGKNQTYHTVGNMLDLSFNPTPKALITSLNVPVIFEYNSKRFFAGINLDLIGLSFGKTTDSTAFAKSKQNNFMSASPTKVNLFLGASGTTTNQVYIGYKIREETALKVGVNTITTHYTAKHIENKETVSGKFKNKTAVMPFFSIMFYFEK